MSRLTDLIARAKEDNPSLGAELEREFKALSTRLPFGLNFERHRPEAVELPNAPIRSGDKVRVLPPRGSTAKGDQRLWQVHAIDRQAGTADLGLLDGDSADEQNVPLDDLILIADFRDRIYPGLVSTGKVERGGDKPYHTVINGENYHVLKALTYTHRGKVDAIYIDPPYNTGARDWKYNNDYVESDDLYRHSKWLAMMERRLLIAKELLNPAESVLIVTIDEKEYLRLGLLLEQTFPDASIQMVTSAIKPSGSQRSTEFSRVEEYVYFVMFGDAHPATSTTDMLRDTDRGPTMQSVTWHGLRRRGSTDWKRAHRPNGFYPLFISIDDGSLHSVGEPLPLAEPRSSVVPPDGTWAAWPLDPRGEEGRWQVSPSRLREQFAERTAAIRRTDAEAETASVIYLKGGDLTAVRSGAYAVDGIDEEGKLNVLPASLATRKAKTMWLMPSHDASAHGTALLSRFLPDRRFPFPKSLYAVEDALRFFVGHKKNALILDFFAGSGTTAHAVMRLNRQDNGTRRCILVTNNEVSAGEQAALRERNLRPGDAEWEKMGICEFITKPRITAAITGRTPDGEPVDGQYRFIDEFPMDDGFLANAAFYSLTYESRIAVNHNVHFQRIAPLLWLRAGAQGPIIEKLPESGWAMARTYGLLTDLDQAGPFISALSEASHLRMVFVVTDDNRRFQSIVRELPEGVEPVRLYESYLSNFSFLNGDDV